MKKYADKNTLQYLIRKIEALIGKKADKTLASDSNNGLMSSADYTKLRQIDPGAMGGGGKWGTRVEHSFYPTMGNFHTCSINGIGVLIVEADVKTNASLVLNVTYPGSSIWLLNFKIGSGEIQTMTIPLIENTRMMVSQTNGIKSITLQQFPFA